MMVVSKLFTLILYLVFKTSSEIQLPSVESCDCGVRNYAVAGVRVIGGKEAVANEFPWAALLRIRNNGQYECGGSLINDRFVLTAAHCVPKPEGLDVEVILGAHNISDSTESDTLRLKAVSVSVHEQYNTNINQGFVVYDFALLELNKPVNFSLYPRIRPICMPTPKFVEKQGDPLTMMGWGHTEVYHLVIGNLSQGVGSSPSDTLQKIDVRAVEPQTCQKSFRGLDIKIRDMNLCAKSSFGDTCQGDSGGGLVKKHSNGRFYEIVGVVSFGVGCKSSFNGKVLPGVYARVTSVIGWIRSKISSGNSCRRPTTATTTKTQACSEWGEWTPFSNCTHTSGYGMKTRTKFRTGYCVRGKTFTQDIFCKKIDKPKATSPTPTKTQTCSQWGEWTSFSICRHPTNTYGYGKKARTKFRTGYRCKGTQLTQEKLCFL